MNDCNNNNSIILAVDNNKEITLITLIKANAVNQSALQMHISCMWREMQALASITLLMNSQFIHISDPLYCIK